MDNLSDLLSKKAFDEPAESVAIRKYIQNKYQTEVHVQIRDRTIVIIVGSSALASKLRFETVSLQREANTDKRIQFRIG